jgi:hypothetical protein
MDLGDQADEAWLLGVQRKHYQWSRKHPEDSHRDLWNWITDIRNLRCAWRKVALNKGRRIAFLADWGDPTLDLGHLRHREIAGLQIMALHTDGAVPRTSNFMDHGSLAVED